MFINIETYYYNFLKELGNPLEKDGKINQTLEK